MAEISSYGASMIRIDDVLENMESLSMNNLESIVPISRDVLKILELLSTVSDEIISKINDRHFIFSNDKNFSSISQSKLKIIDSHKKRTLKKIKDIQQVIWDDYVVFAKLMGNMVVDVSQYRAEKDEYKTLQKNWPRSEEMDRSRRRLSTVQGRIVQNIDKFNKSVNSFKILGDHLGRHTITFKSVRKGSMKPICESTVSLFTELNELDILMRTSLAKANPNYSPRFDTFPTKARSNLQKKRAKNIKYQPYPFVQESDSDF